LCYNCSKTVSTSFSVNVHATNDPPIPNPAPGLNITVNEDSPSVTKDLSAYFTDPDNGDRLTYKIASVSNNPPFAPRIVNGKLIVDFLPDANGNGNIVVEATDSQSATALVTFTVQVTAINDPPTVALALTPIVVDEDADPVDIDLSKVFADPDGDILTLAVQNNNLQLITVNTAQLNSQKKLTLTFLPDKSGEAIL